MKAFNYNSQTALFFGNECLKNNEALFNNYGKRAVIFTSKFLDGQKNLALEDVEAMCSRQGIEYLILDEVEVDPSVESIGKLGRKAIEFKPNFFIAIGGGSSIDTAKAASVILKYPEVEDPYEVLYGMGRPAFGESKAIVSESGVPVFAIPTTAGTGAEVTAAAVLTRADIDNKQVMNAKVFCTAAFLDSRYIKESPDFLIHTGVIDALAHGVECCLWAKATNPMNEELAGYGFKLFSEFKDRMITGDLTDDDYDKMMLAAFIQGVALMQSSTSLPHGMGYALSHFKHVNHGLSCGIFLGEYVRGFKDQSLVQPIVEKCGFKNSDEFAEFCKKITEDDVNIEVTKEEITKWTDDFMAQQAWRIAGNAEPATRDDIEALYTKSLARYIK